MLDLLFSMSLRRCIFSLTLLNQFAFEAPADHYMTHWTARTRTKSSNKQKTSKSIQGCFFFFHPSINSSYPRCVIPGFLRYFSCASYLHSAKCCVLQQHISNSLHFLFAVSCDRSWHILCVYLPLSRLFHSCSSLDPSSFPCSRECVKNVCVCGASRSAFLVSLGEGLCSLLNTPPTLPATATEKRSFC